MRVAIIVHHFTWISLERPEKTLVQCYQVIKGGADPPSTPFYKNTLDSLSLAGFNGFRIHQD